MNHILTEVVEGKRYPECNSTVYADMNITQVTVSLTISPLWVDLDGPNYIERKYKKYVSALKCIGVSHNMDTKEQVITVVMEIKGRFNSIKDVITLENMGEHIAHLAKERLSEDAILKNIGMDCKPWIENEEAATDEDA